MKDISEDFVLPLGKVPAAHAAAVLSSPAFQNFNIPEDEATPLTLEDHAWIQKTVEEGTKSTPAPSIAAERYLRKAFSEYAFDMPVTEGQWRNFVLTKWYQQANDPDPKVAKSALDSIAKSCAANLMVEKKEISVTNVTDEELKKDLRNMFQQLLSKAQERVIEGEAVRT